MRINWRASSLHAAVMGFADSLIQLVSAFGVHLTATQDVAITSTVSALLLVLSIAVISSTNGEASPGGGPHA